MTETKEKKVEYLELIYDLIFVYIIGHSNSVLHNVENGFVTGGTFLSYIVCTLAAIQIWNFTTFYVNLYGRNSVRDHVFMFTNMYLLYHIGCSISEGLECSYFRFCTAWTLILANIAVQHIIEIKNHKETSWEIKQLKRKAFIIFAEAVLTALCMPLYYLTGISFAFVPILFGIIATILSKDLNSMVPVDFAHLSERAMLYVVFTFGEMIISIGSYFSGRVTWSSIYFSVMAFLIIVGLFLSYGTLYNKIIDKETVTNGTGYMMIHVFLIFSLNNISVAFEFMRDEKIDILQKTVLIVSSFVLYFSFMFMTEKYAKCKCTFGKRNALLLCIGAVCFILLMLLLRRIMTVNIAVTAVFVYGVFLLLYRQGKKA